MKHFLSILFLCFISLHTVLSQDLITKRDGEDIKAKVLEVDQDFIKYKRFDNLTGPTFALATREVLIIRYENGSKDIFDTPSSQSTQKQQNTDLTTQMHQKGKKDAQLFYTGRNSGSGWTAATTVLFSPILGLIPAAACSSVTPKDKNLNYPDASLINNYDYTEAYEKEAHKIKRRKIWRSFGIGSGIWLILAVAL